MSHQVSEFQNDRVSVVLEKHPHCEVVLNVTVTPEYAADVYHTAIKNVKKEASIPGFRKGKMPENMILTHFSKGVNQEWMRLLSNLAAHEALKLAQVYPYRKDSQIKSDAVTVSLTEPSVFKYTFETHPEIPVIDVTQITVKKGEVKPIGDEDVTAYLDNMQKFMGKWSTVEENRPLELGDYAEIDVDNLDNGEKLCENGRFHVNSKELGQWLIDLIVGLKVGESAEGMSQKPEGFGDKEFIPTNCRVTLKGIYKLETRELNDEFAALFQYPSMEAMRESIVKYLENEQDKAIAQDLREQIKTQLLSHPFEVPKHILEEEIKYRLDHSKKTAGVDEGPVNPATVAEMSEKAIRLFFLISELARAHQIHISKNEVDAIKKHVPEGQDVDLFSVLEHKLFEHLLTLVRYE